MLSNVPIKNLPLSFVGTISSKTSVNSLVSSVFFRFCARICKDLAILAVLAALAFIVPAAAVAGEMWEPAFCAGFQALWESWESRLLTFPRFPRRGISTAKPARQPKQPLCGYRQASGLGAGPIRHVSKSRVECILLQFLVQSRFLLGSVRAVFAWVVATLFEREFAQATHLENTATRF